VLDHQTRAVLLYVSQRNLRGDHVPRILKSKTPHPILGGKNRLVAEVDPSVAPLKPGFSAVTGGSRKRILYSTTRSWGHSLHLQVASVTLLVTDTLADTDIGANGNPLLLARHPAPSSIAQIARNIARLRNTLMISNTHCLVRSAVGS
jgi:hypothetical protein